MRTDPPVIGEQETDTRPYEIIEGGETIKSMGGFQLGLVKHAHIIEDSTEKYYVDLLNGSITNLCDSALLSQADRKTDDLLPHEFQEQRPEWLNQLREQADKFLWRQNAVLDCLKTTANVIGKIQSSIRQILEKRRKEDPQKREAFAGTLYAEMVDHKRQEAAWRWAHHVLVAGSIIGNIVGTVAVLSNSLTD